MLGYGKLEIVHVPKLRTGLEMARHIPRIWYLDFHNEVCDSYEATLEKTCGNLSKSAQSYLE